ncbi:hypothetical protein QE152_g7879 [Popillia japonica]|uniref:CCHC-type domain-containing protein n=1 Tax=Popillia japonica TaxID=7064 RepID=A0AAW1MCM7_POPJA
MHILPLEKCAVKNKFGPLAGQNDNEPITDIEMPSAEEERADTDDSAPVPSQTKQVKPPCFPTRLREKYSEFSRMLNAVSTEYHIQFAGDSTLVYYRAKADYDKFVQRYKSTVPFYTYTPKGEKTNAYVIKGLHEDVEKDEIKNELLELGVQVSAVTRFKRSKYPIFMCVVKKSVTLKDLQKAGRYLQHTRVYYEPHTSKKETIQCHKCQQWGHATANCFLSVVRCVKCQQWGHATANCFLSVVRCVKCGQGHKAAECTLPREQPAKCCKQRPTASSACHLSVVRCVKCGQGHKAAECTLPREQPAKCCNCGKAHPASSSKCSAYIKFLENREQKRTKNGAASAARAARYVPAPPPKANAWDKTRFPPLPTKQTMPSPSTSSPTQVPAERGRTAGARSAPPPAVDEDLSSMSEIADIMRDIKRMVDLKALAAGLRALKEKLQGCRNNFEKAMAIDEFNAGDFNGCD